MVGNRLEVCLFNVQKRLRSKQIKSGNLEESIQEYEKTAISDFKAG